MKLRAISINCVKNNYNKQNQKLFYVAVTRAMNKLNIYYDDVPSSLIV